MKFSRWKKSKESNEKIDILNSKGDKLKYQKNRVAKLNKEEFVKVVHIWIKNSDGKYLVQQRAVSKKEDPLLWSITSGFVSSEEDCLETVKRELKEELNLDIDLNKLKKIKTLSPIDGFNHIADVYMLETSIKTDKLKLQKEEVNAVSLWTEKEIKNNIKNKKFYDFDQVYPNYFNYIF